MRHSLPLKEHWHVTILVSLKYCTKRPQSSQVVQAFQRLCEVGHLLL